MDAHRIDYCKDHGGLDAADVIGISANFLLFGALPEPPAGWMPLKTHYTSFQFALNGIGVATDALREGVSSPTSSPGSGKMLR